MGFRPVRGTGGWGRGDLYLRAEKTQNAISTCFAPNSGTVTSPKSLYPARRAYFPSTLYSRASPSIFSSLCFDGQCLSPNEQKTQHTPASGRRIAPQRAHW